MMTLRFCFWIASVCLIHSLAGQTFPALTHQKFIDNFGIDHPRQIVKANDGHLLLGGHTVMYDSIGSDCGNIWIVKVDTLGTLLWEREINMSGCEELRAMVEAEDGSILFTATTTSLIPQPERGGEMFWSNVMVGKIDPQGQVAWLQSFGGSNQDQPHALIKSMEHYAVVGMSHSADGEVGQNYGMADAWTLRIDEEGRMQQGHVIGGSGQDWALAASLCHNGDIVMAGYTDSPELSNRQLSPAGNGLLARLSPRGDLRWIRTFSCPDGGYFTQVQEDSVGRLLVAGQYRNRDGEQRFWWLKLSENGAIIREKIIPGPEPGKLTAADLCSVGYILGGYTRSTPSRGTYGKGGEDFWLVRLDNDGNVAWKNTYGGPEDERCVDVLEYRPGLFYALGQKVNRFTRQEDQDQDFWLLRIEEFPADSIQGSIYVRTNENRIFHQQPTRFSAKFKYGDRFLWDFGDGTTSEEAHPLKSYAIPGLYDVTLTIFVNEHCRQTVRLPRSLEVW